MIFGKHKLSRPTSLSRVQNTSEVNEKKARMHASSKGTSFISGHKLASSGKRSLTASLSTVGDLKMMNCRKESDGPFDALAGMAGTRGGQFLSQDK